MSSGHIRRQSANSWELKFEAGIDPMTGRRKIAYRTVRGTKREAQAELVRLLGEAAHGTLVDHSRETLGAFLIRWDRDWASTNVSPKTRERWRELAVNQIVPRLGNAPIQRIKPSHLAELYAELMREGSTKGGPLAAATVGHCHRLLRRALGHAVTWGLIQQNPAAIARPPRAADTEIKIASDEEITLVLEHLKRRHGQLHALATLALATGARRGELCALTWKDFNAGTSMLRIERALESTKACGLRVKAPKTKHGRRTISIAAPAVEELRAHWKMQQEERLALGLGRATPDDLIFGHADGSPYNPDTLSKDWLCATTAAVGRPINLHSLRHHHAAVLIASGVDILALSRRLGHANPTITLSVYGHLYPSAVDKVTQAVDEMFARVRRQ
jgi:integrase